MAQWSYAALDERGRRRRGTVEGDNARHVRSLLREQGLRPLNVRPAAPGIASRFRLGKRRALGSEALAQLTRQLATLLRGGLPLDAALNALAAQRARHSEVLVGVRARVQEGYSFAEALDASRRTFPELLVATVGAGERIGRLEEVLERLAEHFEKRQALRQQVRAALAYPMVLTVFSLAIVSLMLVYVVPQVTPVFVDSGVELPRLTRVLMAVSDFARTWGWLALLAAAAVCGLLARALRLPAARLKLHRLLLRTPLFGALSRELNSARLMQSLSTLTDAGVSVWESLRVAARMLTNLPMRQAAMDAAREVSEGKPAAEALDRDGLFPPLCIQLIASGEASGELHQLLGRAAETQERELSARINTLTSLLQPVLIMLVGGFVLLIVLSILMPIFEMNRLVGQ
ncbi:MAG: type II secretion system inner membrane protein GspF [Gammaproteobacteria bacterium]|nr:type II secretion system inner membrane protein GspF [Gammaproteobacteria bacterium]MDE0412791.1 type II secretion system inner membrane protein GspF [Gammaproteobacteria bacterium]